jgi:predicted homoserine dehydrogenase-like protein
MLIMGLAAISACASNEASVDTDESSAKMTKEQMQAEAAEEAAEVEAAVEAEAVVEAEEAEEVVEAAEAEAMIEAEAEAGSTGNLVSTCNHDGQVRIITIVYDNEETGKACEVNYEKSTGVETLWSANTDKDYCMEQAVEFVKKQEGWGWDCSELE